jgi:hypothetical protein
MSEAERSLWIERIARALAELKTAPPGRESSRRVSDGAAAQ